MQSLQLDKGDAMTTTKPFQLGSVSQGTLRTEDLLLRFTDALWQLSRGMDLASAEKLIEEANDILGSDLNDFKDYAQDLINGIESALQDYCPPFVYFGAHPGDGADFGFWPDMEAIHESIASDGYGGEEPGEYVLDDVIMAVDQLNHVTVLDLDRNVLWSTV